VWQAVEQIACWLGAEEVLGEADVMGAMRPTRWLKNKGVNMQIFMIHNEGAGFAGHLEVEIGMTVERLFDSELAGGNLNDYLVRVNRLPAAGSKILEPGDRVSFTPTKIEGAARRRETAPVLQRLSAWWALNNFLEKRRRPSASICMTAPVAAGNSNFRSATHEASNPWADVSIERKSGTGTVPRRPCTGDCLSPLKRTREMIHRSHPAPSGHLTGSADEIYQDLSALVREFAEV
jgi:hypothetical protein